jgi:hypothetical protein
MVVVVFFLKEQWVATILDRVVWPKKVERMSCASSLNRVEERLLGPLFVDAHTKLCACAQAFFLLVVSTK